jgi:hypothetical protein
VNGRRCRRAPPSLPVGPSDPGPPVPALPEPILGPDWLQAANERLARVSLPDPDPEGPLALRAGLLVVTLVATEPPGELLSEDRPAGAELAVTLRVEQGRAELVPGRAADAQVTVVLPYSAAVELARGGLQVGEALLEGRVKVRGDLGVLLAGQQLLASLQPALRGDPDPVSGPPGT